VVEACLRGGARLLQLRCKEESSGAFLALADAAVAAARSGGAKVIVNDRVDIARMCGAAGVHVGQDDLPSDEVRRLIGPGAIVGVSTHDRDQIDVALAGPATYVAVGPIFSTSNKDTGYSVRGQDLGPKARGSGKPIVEMASTVAVITDLLSGDPEARTRAFLAL
jgi:thiamine-phosphate pyrophosphorylase